MRRRSAGYAVLLWALALAARGAQQGATLDEVSATDQCDRGMAESCRWLAERARAGGDPVRFRQLMSRAAELDRAPCDTGDVDACDRLYYSYRDLQDPRQRRIAKRLCEQGSDGHCVYAEQFDDNRHRRRKFEVMPSATLGWESGIGWGGGLSVLMGKHTVKNGSSEGWHGASHSVNGLLLQADAGQRGGRVSVGWGYFDRPPDTLIPHTVEIGLALKAVYLHEWEEGPQKGRKSLGGEVELDLLGLRLAAGYLKPEDTGGRFTWGLGVRF